MQVLTIIISCAALVISIAALHNCGKGEIITDKYASQKKHLSEKKQLRVWVNAEKFDRFKKTVAVQNDSIYRLINEYVDNYLAANEDKQ